MRLPLLIITDRAIDEVARDPALQGYRLISNSAAPAALPDVFENCFCCTGQSALRDALNQAYLDWAYNKDGVKPNGAIVFPSLEADLKELEEFLRSDVMTAARWTLIPVNPAKHGPK